MKQELMAPTSCSAVVTSPAANTAIDLWTTHQAYHELADIPVREVDLVESVQENLQHLEELQARLGFMMREVKYLLKLG